MKAFTDIEQSKKLAEILPIESADMRYAPFNDTRPWIWEGDPKLLEKDSVLCWSLAALLEQLPDKITTEENDGIGYTLHIEKEGTRYYLSYVHYFFGTDSEAMPYQGEVYETKYYNNLVDACYEMILKLKEKN